MIKCLSGGFHAGSGLCLVQRAHFIAFCLVDGVYCTIEPLHSSGSPAKSLLVPP